MLVLTRRVRESLVIDGDIRVTVLAINGSKVRLGFEAPASVCVLRGEVFLRESAGRVEAGSEAATAETAGSGQTL